MEKHPMDGWVMLICNPVSGSGQGLARLSRVKETLRAARVRFAAEVTSRRWDAMRLARSAVLEGCSAVVAIGGDGTFFEVVNGVMDPATAGSSPGYHVAVGLVQAGRGSDFGRSAGIPGDVESACARLLGGRTEAIDLGYTRHHTFGGAERGLYFANAAGLGFDAEVSLRANGAPRVFGGTLPYLSSLLLTLGAYRNKRIDVTLDSGEPWHGRVNSVVVANGQYFGGGMRIAPEAALQDGQFEVVVLGDLGKVELVRNVPRVYVGTHVTHPKVSVFRAQRLHADSPDRLLLQADGEVLGTAPASFEVVPAALRLIV